MTATFENIPKSVPASATYFLLIDDADHFLLIDDANHTLLLQDEQLGTSWVNQQKSS